MKKTGPIKTVLNNALFYIILIIIGQVIFYICTSVIRCWKPYFFPNIVGVYKSFINMINDNVLFLSVWSSLQRAFIGYLISLFVGVLFGLIISHFRTFSQMIKPLFLGIQTLPSICWVPFAILWFGLSDLAIIFVIVMGSSFSIALSVDSAINNVNPIYIKAAQTMGANTRAIYTKVILPASIPSAINGAKQGWSFAWRSLMAGEVMSASNLGLGQALVLGRDLADINRVTLVIIIIIIIGAFIEKFVFSIIEHNILKKVGINNDEHCFSTK